MWVVVINPVSGAGKGAILGAETAGFFAAKGLPYQIITATSAEKLRSNLADFLDSNLGAITGVIAVGGWACPFSSTNGRSTKNPILGNTGGDRK